MNRPKSHRDSAFTIIEMMVAVFVFSLVLASLFGSWRVMRSGVDGGLRVAAEAQRVRMTAVTIEQALTGAQFFQGNAPLYSFNVDTSGTHGALSFVSNLGDSFPGSGVFNGERVRRVTFTVEPTKESDSSLVMRQNSLLAPAEQVDDPVPIVLARDVSVFQLEFWDSRKGEYAPEWLFTNQLPRIVRFTVGFGAEGKYSKHPKELFTRAVYLPSSGVPGFMQGSTPLPGAPGGGGLVPSPVPPIQ
jgi:prepilin-type N-terminal cleavage/methylation domain-containing protein